MSPKLISLASLAFVIGFCGSMAGGQENQIVGGEFDDGLAPWNSYGAAGFTLNIVQGAGLSGKNALVIDVADAEATASIGVAQGGLSLVQGETYQIGFTAKAEQDREMVALFQIYNPAIPQWLTPWEETVQLTTSPQSFNFEYLHESETTTEHPDWSVDFYLILKGTWWNIDGADLNGKVWIDRVYFGAETPRQSVGAATDPDPADGVKFVDPDVTLRWTAGFGTKFHHLYFGDNSADVEAGAAGTYKGPLVDPRFAASELERERTYYWRVDEFDGANTHEGDLWSFMVAKEGGGLKAEYFNNVTLAGGPVLVRVDPEIDFDWGNGDVPGENSPAADINVDNFSARWSGELEIDLTDAYTFHVTANNGFRLWLDGALIIDLWNNPATSSLASEPIELTGGTSHSIRMEYVEDTGAAIAQLYWESSTREMQIIPQAALSLPIRANSPSPPGGATGVPMDQVLTWGAGDFAVSHDVYFGTDAEAVANATQTSPEFKGTRALGNESYDPGPLGWGVTYYWRVDEVNDAHADSPWIGNLWNFTTVDYVLVDDFESYTDDDAAGQAIWQHWIDGFGIANNGAQVGYLLPPYAEQTIVHSGAQSMPLLYDNTGDVTNSEAELTLTTQRDWTEQGVGVLSLWFRGDPANAAEPMYLSVSNANGSPVMAVYEDPTAATTDDWTEWVVPLQTFADQGINLRNVDKIAIGLGDKGDGTAAGGSGTMYFDDIRLYRL
ncbi:MAG: PA14 domain-containing protein [Sedimentisphaerales bacterium]